MLPKQKRLTSSRDFRTVFSAGKAYVDRMLVLKVRYKAENEPGRVGFSTSSKLGNAVVRNRAKRLLREAVRLLGERLKPSGYDAVLIARPPVREAHLADISQSVEHLFRRARLLTDENRDLEKS